jgi:aerobic-type carbon monoxide dehydrogenase small subunit (CoxS/CutS family)
LTLTVNERVQQQAVADNALLVDVARTGLTGTKQGCDMANVAPTTVPSTASRNWPASRWRRRENRRIETIECCR